MFVDALAKARDFTRPLVISMRHYDGTVQSGVAAFIVLNADGWFITAAHAMEAAVVLPEHEKQIRAYEQKAHAIKTGPGTLPGKQKRLRALAPNDKWLTNFSFWWGGLNGNVQQLHVLGEADLALGRLDGIDPSSISNYPVLKLPPDMEPGRSLCRLGFPFHEISATFDPKKGFELAPDALPIPFFPIDGIMTRIYMAGASPSGVDVKLLETSSPGLLGQSGGPIVDVEGRVWAMQSRTNHLPLGFSPAVERAGKKIEEHQFLNVGLGVHSETIQAFLQQHGATVATA